jgi:hypothetical protein
MAPPIDFSNAYSEVVSPVLTEHADRSLHEGDPQGENREAIQDQVNENARFFGR